jgi:hypothetical protein
VGEEILTGRYVPEAYRVHFRMNTCLHGFKILSLIT